MIPADSSSSRRPPGENSDGVSPLDWPQRVGAIDDVLGELNELGRRRRRRRRLGATALVAAVLVAGGMVWRQSATIPSAEDSLASIIVVSAAHRTLPDGSTVDLKEGANIEVAFTSGVRAVNLRNGAAHFQVAKNPTRPFVVTAAGITVGAVGTAFCVDRESQSVEVIVTEGRVSVAPAAYAAQRLRPGLNMPGSASVGAGEHVVLDATPDAAGPQVLTVERLGPRELADKLIWLNPRLEFTGTPLRMVVMMFNQHNQVRLVLEDPKLQDLQLSGILRSNNIPALLHMLDTNFHIQAEHRGNDEIILRKAP